MMSNRLGFFGCFFFLRVLPSSSGFSPLYTYYRTLHNDAQISSPDGRNEQHTRTFFFPPSFYSRPFSLSPLSNCMFPCIRFLFDLQSNWHWYFDLILFKSGSTVSKPAKENRPVTWRNPATSKRRAKDVRPLLCSNKSVECATTCNKTSTQNNLHSLSCPTCSFYYFYYTMYSMYTVWHY